MDSSVVVQPIAQDAILRFLNKMGINSSADHQENVCISIRVEAMTKDWAFQDRIRPHIMTGTVMAETAYSHLKDPNVQAAVAVFTALMTALDDPDIFRTSGAQDFARMLCDGSAHSDPGLLGQLTKVLSELGRHFSAFNTTCIIAATLRGLGGETLWNSSSRPILEPQLDRFFEYQRRMTGASEAYAAFIWSDADLLADPSYIRVLPDIYTYIDHTNDILSFYKESLAEDANTYVHSRSCATGKSLTETLCEVVDEVVAAAARVRTHLGTGPVRDAWDSFESGYVYFHVRSPRYRLREVIGDEVM